ncbi:uncharacterized protein HMPREF1541_00508 [Cyphellophora europaea CBS 101466]|uniref:CS domain-containing protein n=1 Tax=Cyphellophora europaea (strain CBS 101466) TaxID=1220924 RepID=W2SEI7_CYPE1|nr:uncharacterized protein HMPREF1541_00508 [Cyphellophora europaea CBS 101466]ETN46324.1 hypothetical protein HMPREF1541_00508 [Cyphellophora europaea CBS 101466]
MATAAQPQKCVHKGCGKKFTDPSDPPCIYHPGPPEFHEGQKGWKCCKPRVLTFDEFLEIPPCTTGQHSAVDDGPKVEFSDTSKIGQPDEVLPKEEEVRKVKPLSERAKESLAASVAQAQAQPIGTPRSSTPQPALEEDSDEETDEIPQNASCKRKACGERFAGGKRVRSEEKCVFHPGVPVFHEGSKGYTCCKRRVLEFDEFMRIKGCKEREGHCFVGKREKAREAEKKAQQGSDGAAGEEKVEEVRTDYYQTATSVIVSFFLKKIRKEDAKVVFGAGGENGYVDLDLPTADNKRFKQRVVFWAEIDPEKSSSKVMGTKLELNVAKKGDGMTGWPVLKQGDRETGERIQIGRAGRA